MRGLGGMLGLSRFQLGSRLSPLNPAFSNIIAGYNLNELSGNAVDFVNGRNGVVHGNVTQGVAAKLGLGYEFNGVDGNYVEVASDSIFDTLTEVSLSVWFKVIDNSGSAQILVAKAVSNGAHVNPYFSWSLHCYSFSETTCLVRFWVSTMDGAWVSIDTSVQLNTMSLVIGTYKVGEPLTIYGNNVKNQGAVATSPIKAFEGTSVFIGSNGAYSEVPNGLIDQVCIYNKFIADEQASLIWNNGDGVER